MTLACEPSSARPTCSSTRLMRPPGASCPGAPVVLANDCGRLPLTLSISDIVPPGVALVHKGRWPKLDPSGANVNVLNAGRKTDLAESSAVHAVEADLTRDDGRSGPPDSPLPG